MKNNAMRCVKRVESFGENSTIHGLKYILSGRRSIFARIFWLLVIVLSGYCLYSLVLTTLKMFSESTVVFTPNTFYLDWDTNFPAVTVCEKYDRVHVLGALAHHYPPFIQYEAFYRRKFFADMLFTSGSCSLCAKDCTRDLNCSVDWRALVDSVRRPCQEVIYNCSWNGDHIDCCQHFLIIDTGLGPCYSFNTLQSRSSGSVPMKTTNITAGPGHLTFHYRVKLDVYVHGVDEVPLSSDTSFVPFQWTEHILQMDQIDTSPHLLDVGIDVRQCRYYHEKIATGMESFMVYGYSACMTACETQRHLDKCGCIHFLRDKIYQDQYCNYTGLKCIADFIESLKTPTEMGDAGYCKECLPSCTEYELTTVFYNRCGNRGMHDPPPRVDVRLASIPTFRYTRDLLRDKLNIVVSIGGLLGLFFGASLISLVEIIYYILWARINN